MQREQPPFNLNPSCKSNNTDVFVQLTVTQGTGTVHRMQNQTKRLDKYLTTLKTLSEASLGSFTHEWSLADH